MNIVQNLKKYFSAKTVSNNNNTPEGICPNCWGKQEWDGEFFRLNKGNKLIGNDQTYSNFIQKIVESNIEGIAIKEDSYTCETCKTSFE